MSKRKINEYGHMKVEDCILTAEQVNEYTGDELMSFDPSLNVNPNDVYRVYRPLSELRKALDSFNSIGLVNDHVPITQETTEEDKKNWLGTTGGKAYIKDGAVYNSLNVWDSKGVKLIQDALKKGLSAGYKQKLVKESGQFEGVPYDYKFVDLLANHIALVHRPRVKRSMVADSENIKTNKPKGVYMSLVKKLFGMVKDAESKAKSKSEIKNEISEMKKRMDELKKEDADGNKEEIDKIMESVGELESLLTEHDDDVKKDDAKDYQAMDENEENSDKSFADKSHDKYSGETAKKVRDLKIKLADHEYARPDDTKYADYLREQIDALERGKYDQDHDKKESKFDKEVKKEMTMDQDMVSKIVAKQLKENAVARDLAEKVLGKVQMAFDAQPESIIDEVLKAKGLYNSSESYEIKRARVETLATMPKQTESKSMAMDSSPMMSSYMSDEDVFSKF